MKKIIFVVATRCSTEEFFTSTATGKTLGFYNFPFVDLDLYAENSVGLAEIYNQSIEKYLESDVVLVFAHDDIHILDFYWAKHLYEGLSNYDIVGIVGNRQRSPMQPSWAFLNTSGTWDRPENFSGIIGHGTQFPGTSLEVFGTTGEVKLLDGLFIASSTNTLKKHSIRFDPKFKFHFYDMDICRTATNAGLRLGTIPISLIHESKGNFSSPEWRDTCQVYFDKWGD